MFAHRLGPDSRSFFSVFSVSSVCSVVKKIANHPTTENTEATEDTEKKGNRSLRKTRNKTRKTPVASRPLPSTQKGTTHDDHTLIKKPDYAESHRVVVSSSSQSPTSVFMDARKEYDSFSTSCWKYGSKARCGY